MNEQNLDEFWITQKRWSTLSDQLKSDLAFWRKTVLLLSIGGAFLSTLSTQVPAGTEQKICAWLGAALLAIIPVVTPKKLSPEKTKEWTVARSVSEGIKAELYAFLAQAGPYSNSDGDRIQNLNENTHEITNSAKGLLQLLALVEVEKPSIPVFDSPEDYLKKRVEAQEDWYDDRARQHGTSASKLREVEFYLAIAAALMAAATGVIGEELKLFGHPVEIGAWVAVLTTIGGTLTAHIAAARYDHMVTSYSATAHQLGFLRQSWRSKKDTKIPSAEWSEFVRECEDAISKENEAWLAKWVKGNK